MRTYYDLLGVEPGAAASDIKRAFRREIARYHPDKVQHLGVEFQDIASARAAELTEAYRILMDDGERRKYDSALAAPPAAPPVTPGARNGAPPAVDQPPAAPPGADRRTEAPRAATDLVVKKAALGMFREAVTSVSAGAAPSAARGFDAAYLLKGKRPLFGTAEPGVRVLARFVPHVDAAAVAATWPLGRAAATAGDITCVLLLGAGLAPPGDLSAAVAEQRRKARNPGFILIPVDVRNWEALLPPDTPAPVRAILQRLGTGR